MVEEMWNCDLTNLSNLVSKSLEQHRNALQSKNYALCAAFFLAPGHGII